VSAAWCKTILSLLAIGFFCLLAPRDRAQESSQAANKRTLKEFQENGSSYFPASTFVKPDGSPDENLKRFGNTIAWYLRGIGEPPLRSSAENLEPHAYRLIVIGFPVGTMFVLRLQIE